MQSKRSKIPSLAYTVGEPAGIGLDIILQLASKTTLRDIVCIGDLRCLKKRAELLGLGIEFVDVNENIDNYGQLRVLHTPVIKPDVCGVPNAKNVAGVLAMLDRAIDGCVAGEFSAMVTGPLHKGVINDAQIAFSGHTEYLAERTGAKMPVMLLATPELRVALITTHLPLKDVSKAITRQRIQEVCRVINTDLRLKFKIDDPKMLVCGLNPHAGEEGHLGSEEIEIIIPALNDLRKEGLQLVGPLPADTLFTKRFLGDADVIIAMYHDQGLPVLKSMGFGNATNITLGLPINRTSVDHGTAFDFAGSGQANMDSLKMAISVARKLST